MWKFRPSHIHLMWRQNNKFVEKYDGGTWHITWFIGSCQFTVNSYIIYWAEQSGISQPPTSISLQCLGVERHELWRQITTDLHYICHNLKFVLTTVTHKKLGVSGARWWHWPGSLVCCHGGGWDWMRRMRSVATLAVSGDHCDQCVVSWPPCRTRTGYPVLASPLCSAALQGTRAVTSALYQEPARTHPTQSINTK